MPELTQGERIERLRVATRKWDGLGVMSVTEHTLDCRAALLHIEQLESVAAAALSRIEELEGANRKFAAHLYALENSNDIEHMGRTSMAVDTDPICSAALNAAKEGE